MERIAFLIEKTGERIDCLLNPESLEISRRSGLRERRQGGHLISGRGGADHPLLYTGGGTTEVALSLLFDVALRSSLVSPALAQPESPVPMEPVEVPIEDVRTLTDRIWKLAEHNLGEQGDGQATLARIIWGKAWNILGVVTAVSERFESFTASGVPQRSWIRLSFRRVPDEVVPTATETETPPAPVEPAPDWQQLPAPSDLPLLPAESPDPGDACEPLYNIAVRNGLPPSAWRAIAYAGNIVNPLKVPIDTPITLPPRASSS